MIVRHLENIGEELLPAAVAIGVFDGVHRGHQALLRQAAEVAPTVQAVPTALTFDPHPSAVLAPARTPALLGTLRERLKLLQAQGAEQIVVARFDQALAAQTPSEFIHEILLKRLHVRAVVVGEDFRFGCDRSGDVNALRRAGDKHGFVVAVVPPVFVNSMPARSTTIRQLLTGGKVEEASLLLGRAYALTGTVVHGRKLGRTIGFPTANMAIAPGIQIPADGVYAGTAVLETGETVRAAVSIGTNPTVTPSTHQRTVEAFLMEGFDRDLYDQTLSVQFVAYLRPTIKFDSLDALIAQMHQDIEQAKHHL
jgi:riboflavin kinase/FMN adenylyltransferase